VKARPVHRRDVWGWLEPEVLGGAAAVTVQYEPLLQRPVRLPWTGGVGPSGNPTVRCRVVHRPAGRRQDDLSETGSHPGLDPALASGVRLAEAHSAVQVVLGGDLLLEVQRRPSQKASEVSRGRGGMYPRSTGEAVMVTGWW
jgi:hypothetical protein